MLELTSGPAVSKAMEYYFRKLKGQAEEAAEIAEKARARGFDPRDDVEIPFAEDLAGRVEKLVGPEGVADRIRELSDDMGRERLMLTVAMEVAQELVDQGENRTKALDQATRTGLAILTEGVLVAPLEGIAEVKVGTNADGSTYADLYFAGPIRAAGGTAQAMSVLIADQVRKALDIGDFKVGEQEIARYIEEFQLYRNLQYKPTNDEIEHVVRNCPVCINGEGTEKEEVQGNRDLPRVETNQVRSGVCLVIAEGVLLKAKKILKITKALDIKGWEFLKEMRKKKDDKGSVSKEEELMEKLISMKDVEDGGLDGLIETTDEDGNYMDFAFDADDREDEIIQITDEGLVPTVEATMKYIKDLIAGRPVFSHPSRPGGFRLRYGRGRGCGLASIGVNPATLFVTEEFLATGTQVKIERPGKAGAITSVDSIEGPTALLDNGDLLRIDDMDTMRKVKGRISSLTDIGEILIPFGEFAENNHKLIQGSYTEDWWKWEVQCALYMVQEGIKEHPFEESFYLQERIDDLKEGEMEKYKKAKKSEKLSKEDLFKLQRECEEWTEKKVKEYLKDAADRARQKEREIASMTGEDLEPLTPEDALSISERLKVPLHPRWTLYWHDISIAELNRLRNHIMDKGVLKKDGHLEIEKGPEIKEILIKLGCQHRQEEYTYLIGEITPALLRCLGLGQDLSSGKKPRGFSKAKNIMQAVTMLAGVEVRERSPTRIGARMGRPEKADIRQMKPPVHGLYPVGIQGGNQRLLRKTFSSGAEANTVPHLCPECRKITPFKHCPDCGQTTMVQSSRQGRDEMMMINTKEEAERAAKMLRFTSIDVLPDVKGVKGLISTDKIPERLEKAVLRAKHGVFVFRDGTVRYDMTDITLTHFRPREIGAPVEKLRELGYTRDLEGSELENEDQLLELKVQDIVVSRACGDYLLKVSKFVDDELEMIYGEKRYYNAEKKEDLIGALGIGLAPHTSGGVLCRIIGFTGALGCMGHPFFHASKRRNCDGDEDAIMLLMDGLLNFSRLFLPEKRGGQMDAPLVLSMRLDPSEVDKEAHNVDVRKRYPLDFYLATLRKERINDYWMRRMDSVKFRLHTPLQFEGFHFTNDTSDINLSPKVSAYKTIGVTEEKIDRQLDLAKRIRAVDEDDVAERVLRTHLLPDLIGNLRSFAQQSFRCTKCGAKYRRIPLSGKCVNLLMTPKPHRCNNKLILTVSEGSVRKYLDIAMNIARDYDVSDYIRQRIDIMSSSIETMFPTRFRSTTLDSFM